MKFFGALSVSLALHFLLVQWRWAPVLEDSGSAGRAALAIQRMRFVEVKKTELQDKFPQETLRQETLPQETLPQEKKKPEAKKKQHKEKPQKEPSLLAASASLPELESTDVSAEENKEKPITEKKVEVVPPLTKQISEEQEQDIQPEMALPEIEEPLLEQVDKEILAEVVSSSEKQDEHAGFDQLPTMEQPRYRKAFPPNYPRLARRKGQQGTVMVKAKVGLDGEVKAVELLESSGYVVLDNCALKTVKQWQFYPYQVDQKFAVAWVEVPVEFTLGP